jgi:hypothetical protein
MRSGARRNRKHNESEFAAPIYLDGADLFDGAGDAILRANRHRLRHGRPIKLENAFTRPTLGGASVAVGYMTLTNAGKTDIGSKA